MALNPTNSGSLEQLALMGLIAHSSVVGNIQGKLLWLCQVTRSAVDDRHKYDASRYDEYTGDELQGTSCRRFDRPNQSTVINITYSFINNWQTAVTT